MQQDPRYDDVVIDVGRFLVERLSAARDAGIASESLIADPGLGFGKSVAHNLELLARLDELVALLDVHLLVGPSRKAFIARVLAAGSEPPEPDAREEGTLATVVWALDRGAPWCASTTPRSAARGGTAARRHAPGRGPRGMRGRWAQGLEPRNFCWIIQDRLSASERPGGFARNHRKVRRHEELIWLAGHGFTHVLSLLDSPHNLHAYEEAGLAYEHIPLGRHDELAERLALIYKTIAGWLDDPEEKVLVHHEEFGDKILGVLTGYLLYTGAVDRGSARDRDHGADHEAAARVRGARARVVDH